MEFGEAKKAVEAYKAGTGCICDAIKELGHLASASAQTRAHLMMLSQEEDGKKAEQSKKESSS
jgi:hypothetical protein|uniref:Uncharacterized protein n=1 Tax=Siphoviridae sp. ctwHj1 TaxID=2825727 RepID=A0A8S5U649_9CAUD|nr:MAG TPA: hypothetical protein [Siphoviridae sp. ctwHj1]